MRILDESRFCLSLAATDELRAKVRPQLMDEKRAAGEDDGMLPVVEGYAAVYDSPADSGMGFMEVVKPGAFRSSLMNDEDCVAAPEHDWNKAVARRSAGRGQETGTIAPGQLVLEDRADGLYYRFRPVNTQAGRDLVAQLRAGVVTQSSFRFRLRNRMSARVRSMPDGKELRELLDVQLRDVAPVVDPFYPTTSVQLARGNDEDQARSLIAATRELLAGCDREISKADIAQVERDAAAIAHLQVYAKVMRATSLP